MKKKDFIVLLIMLCGLSTFVCLAMGRINELTLVIVLIVTSFGFLGFKMGELLEYELKKRDL